MASSTWAPRNGIQHLGAEKWHPAPRTDAQRGLTTKKTAAKFGTKRKRLSVIAHFKAVWVVNHHFLHRLQTLQNYTVDLLQAQPHGLWVIVGDDDVLNEDWIRYRMVR
jgi:hypothetical protein